MAPTNDSSIFSLHHCIQVYKMSENTQNARYIFLKAQCDEFISSFSTCPMAHLMNHGTGFAYLTKAIHHQNVTVKPKPRHESSTDIGQYQ